MSQSRNARLIDARRRVGLKTQQEFVAAFNAKAAELGLDTSVSQRTVRRWESGNPSWPTPAARARIMSALLGQPVGQLGFDLSARPTQDDPDAPSPTGPPSPPHDTAVPAPQRGLEFATITAAHRRMYWSVPADLIFPAVHAHTRIGMSLTGRHDDAEFAAAVAESSLLAGRLAVFDLDEDAAIGEEYLAESGRFAAAAGDPLLGAAAFAHMAFIPAFTDDPARAPEARDHLRAARTFANRAPAPPIFHAWLDAVEAEVETRLGDIDIALALLKEAQNRLDGANQSDQTPAWFDWFSAARLAGFTGNTLIVAGRGHDAAVALQTALDGLSPDADKQRTVLLADLAAAAVLEKMPVEACEYLTAALDQLEATWYSTGMDRVKSVRESLREWAKLPAVAALDDRLYSWNLTVRALDS